MAIYHLSSKFIGRAKGSSAVAAAAYRHAAKMVNERQMQTVSYESKSNVAHAEVALPDDAPEWLTDKLAGKGPDQQAEALWNAVEKFEKRKDAQLARETVIKASRGTRRALLDMKQSYQMAYGKALARIKTARKTAEVGIPELSKTADETLKRLYSLDGSGFDKALNDSPADVSEIEAFHEAVSQRFGLQHEIFGDKKKDLTDEQSVHLDKLGQHKSQIKLAQSVVDKIDVVRSITRTIKPERKR